jgi:hypothetical protein
MIIKLIEKKLTNNKITILFEELGFVEGTIRFSFLNARSKYKLDTSDDIYIFFDDMMGIVKYVIYCRYGSTLKDDLPNAMSGIIIEDSKIDFYSYPQSIESDFSVKAEHFSLYSLGEIDWETVNILEIVKEIENIEDKPEL